MLWSLQEQPQIKISYIFYIVYYELKNPYILILKGGGGKRFTAYFEIYTGHKHTFYKGHFLILSVTKVEIIYVT